MTHLLNFDLLDKDEQAFVLRELRERLADRQKMARLCFGSAMHEQGEAQQAAADRLTQIIGTVTSKQEQAA